MSGPITNYELGKMQHREYEAQASRYWGQNITMGDKPALSKGRKLALALGGVGVAVVLLVQLLPF